MSDDGYTINISPSTLNDLMTGKSVLMVKVLGREISIKLTNEARAFLLHVFEMTMSKLGEDGWLQELRDSLKRGDYQIKDGALCGPDGTPLRFSASKPPKDTIH